MSARPFGVTYYRTIGTFSTPQSRFGSEKAATDFASLIAWAMENVSVVDVWERTATGWRKPVQRIDAAEYRAAINADVDRQLGAPEDEPEETP